MYQKIPQVFIIDDDDESNFIHKIIIEESNLVGTTRVFESGPDALEALHNLDFDDSSPLVVFLDINMPFMDGWEFLQKLTNFSSSITEKLHIEMLSSSIFHNDREKAASNNLIKGYIVKPLSEENLKQVLKKLNKKHQTIK
ncbi:response regulator [Luteibaculum oceani]|uniref:Response regulator n=1 Tax=Luteibaculum oceani TaxID=1294296 RepID=A0A5C6VKV3_9FLAO|nr:response regulator [Luteibaculum oceani]TXC85374.1 response regulator [Luteibaculum oceani]